MWTLVWCYTFVHGCLWRTCRVCESASRERSKDGYSISGRHMNIYDRNPILCYLSCRTVRHSILLYFKLIQFDSIYYIVQYCISYQKMICVYLFVCPFVCLFICMNKFMFSLLFLFSFSFLMNVLLTHTYTRTHTFIWIYFPSYDSYILLKKAVSEESYLSDIIISYLI